VDEGRSYWAWAVSSTLHGALLLFLILGFASAPKFEDSQEAIPVDTVSETQLNQIMNGEKDAKPAPEPPPAPKTEPAPPSPPQPPPDLRAAEEPTPPPKPEPAPAPKEAEAPTPPQRPKEPPPEKPAPEKPKPDQIAKLVERDKTEPKPTRAYDPNAIAKLIAPKSAPPSGSSSATNAAAATPQGLPHHDAPRMSVSMSSALDAWLTESYLNCWTPPPTLPEGDVYVAEIKVVFNPDGSLSTRPVLLNPPNDPAWRALAESAMRAVRKCDPLHVPPEYAPYFEQWKIETIHFDPRETQG
jgi:outer membrane biosynthesis protein TonB